MAGPLVLAAQNSNRQEIQAVDPRAAKLGVKPGMAVADARAWLPQLVVEAHDPTADAADLRRLADWATRFSPLVAPDGADGVMLDIAGCAHLWGSEAKMLADLDRHLRKFGLHHRAAIADTIGAAWALARFGMNDHVIAPQGNLRPALTQLPPLALRLSPELSEQLKRLGLTRIADLCALPRAALARRFGTALIDRLDQALGQRDEALSPLLPPPHCYVRLDFAEPVSQRTGIDRALVLLLQRLTAALRPHESGPRKLELACYRVDGETQRLFVGTARPSLDAAHLFRLFEDKLDTLMPDEGFEAMRLSAGEVERLRATQTDLDAEDAGSQDLAPLVDRLSNRLGESAVHRFETHESHIPERAVRRLPPLADSPRLHWPKASQRPIRLLPHPEPIEAVAPVPDDPPVQFRWRHVVHRVRAAEGPERIAPEWWLPGEDDAEIRDYYRVEDAEGRRYWLYRAGLYQTDPAPRWYLDGMFG
jgi:protein ImuB